MDRKLASGSSDTTVKIWVLEEKKGPWKIREKTLEGHTNSVTPVTWSHNGQQLASGSWDHTIKIWAAWEGIQTLNRAYRMDYLSCLEPKWAAISFRLIG